MSYSETLTITLPASLIDIANAIARSLDVDVGGADSFKLQQIGTDAEDQPIYADTITVVTPCEPAFKEQVPYLLANPDVLYAQIVSDYSTRWQWLAPPTLQEVQAFCDGVIP